MALLRVKSGYVESKITGFRLEIRDIRIEPFAIVIGPNASGKTLFAKSLIHYLMTSPEIRADTFNWSIDKQPYRVYAELNFATEPADIKVQLGELCPLIVPAERVLLKVLDIQKFVDFTTAREKIDSLVKFVYFQIVQLNYDELERYSYIVETFRQILRQYELFDYLSKLNIDFVDKWFSVSLMHRVIEETIEVLRENVADELRERMLEESLLLPVLPSESYVRAFYAYVHGKPVLQDYTFAIPEGLHVAEILRYAIAAYNYAKYSGKRVLLLVEEPEIHGHPWMVITLGVALARLVDLSYEEGFGEKFVVLVTTHSLDFLAGAVATDKVSVLYTDVEQGKWVLKEWNFEEPVPGFHKATLLSLKLALPGFERAKKRREATHQSEGLVST